jgi:hypothetical protein
VRRWIGSWIAAIALAAQCGQGQTLLYSLSMGNSVTPPRISKTEIWSVDARTGDRRAVFSDEGLDWMLLPTYPGGGERQTMVAAGGKLFARGFSRRSYQGGWPTFPAGLYEVNGKPFLYLRETSGGKLLRRADLSRTALDCLITNIGFMPDGQRMFFTLDTGDDDATSKASYGRVGSYVMKIDGSAPLRSKRAANLVAPLAGKNLYAGSPPAAVLYATDSGTKVRRNYATSATGATDFFRISADGRLAAFIEE